MTNIYCSACGGRWLPRCPGDSPGPCPWCEIRRLRERIAELEAREREVAAKIKSAHDALDAAGVFHSDGTHPQLVSRIGLLVQRVELYPSLRDELHEAQEERGRLRAAIEIALEKDSAEDVRAYLAYAIEPLKHIERAVNGIGDEA